MICLQRLDQSGEQKGQVRGDPSTVMLFPLPLPRNTWVIVFEVRKVNVGVENR